VHSIHLNVLLEMQEVCSNDRSSVTIV